LKDEYQALHITSESIEAKLRFLQTENQDLVARWLRYKNREANVLNSENDSDRIKQEETLSSAIKDALSENRTVSGKTVQAPPNADRTLENESSTAAPVVTGTPTLKQRFADFFLRQTKL
jgi:peptidoglycan hydrolase CwlO-like protein